MEIDIRNIDDLIFSDKRIQKEFVCFKYLFDQWLLGTKVPALRFLAQKSRLELLDKLSLEGNRAILNKYFQENVVVLTMDYHSAKHYTLPLDKVGEITGWLPNFCISRDAEQLYVSTWR
jgi:hypothetical protein